MKEIVSTIIPVYNSEKYLSKCIESVLNQTIRDLECILVDDGSTDSSPSICDKYARMDSRVKVIHQKNARIGAARNAGIDVAIGDYITFLDSDDFIEPMTYEKCLQYMKQDNVDIVEWDIQYFYDDGFGEDEKNKPLPKEHITLNLTNWDTMHYMYNLKHMDSRFNNIGLVTHCVWTKIFKKELFEQGIRFPVGKEYEDELIVHRLMEKARRIITTNERFSHYRLRKESTIHTMPLSGRYNKLEAMEDRFKMILTHDDLTLKKLAARDYMMQIINFYTSAKNNRNDIYRNLCLEKMDILKNNVKLLKMGNRAIFNVFVCAPEIMSFLYHLYRKVR